MRPTVTCGKKTKKKTGGGTNEYFPGGDTGDLTSRLE